MLAGADDAAMEAETEIDAETEIEEAAELGAEPTVDVALRNDLDTDADAVEEIIGIDAGADDGMEVATEDAEATEEVTRLKLLRATEDTGTDAPVSEWATLVSILDAVENDIDAGADGTSLTEEITEMEGGAEIALEARRSAHSAAKRGEKESILLLQAGNVLSLLANCKGKTVHEDDV